MRTRLRGECQQCEGQTNMGRSVCARCMSALVDAQRERRRRQREGIPPLAAVIRLPLPGGGRPVAAPAVKHESQVRRRVMCKRYDRCLQAAIDAQWDGFACDRCEVRDELTFRDAVREMRSRLDRYEVHSRGAV